jgi:hypothetical protein
MLVGQKVGTTRRSIVRAKGTSKSVNITVTMYEKSPAPLRALGTMARDAYYAHT